jgi:ACS family glucarate transporter-like MFS transporter
LQLTSWSLFSSQIFDGTHSSPSAGEYAGLTSGIMNMGAQIGGACTTSLTPLIAKHFGWQMSFFVAAFLAILGALAWLIVDPRRSLLTPDIQLDSVLRPYERALSSRHLETE